MRIGGDLSILLPAAASLQPVVAQRPEVPCSGIAQLAGTHTVVAAVIVPSIMLILCGLTSASTLNLGYPCSHDHAKMLPPFSTVNGHVGRGEQDYAG